MQTYSVPLDKIIRELGLEAIYLPDEAERLSIFSTDVNRPAILLASGYSEYFDNTRMQILGKVEMSYLATLSDDARRRALRLFFSQKPSAVVVSRALAIYGEMLELAKEFAVPLLRTSDTTSNFMAAAIAFLNVELAPCITRHGVLVEVYGEGILINGESGVGKSETAVELIKRGHRLVADDSVELRRVSNKTIVGSSPDNIRHYIELRGLGIINVLQVFGISAVKMTESIDLVVNLEKWTEGKSYSVIGIENCTTDILDIEIPCVTIPVSPGRNLAVIIEVAAMNNRLKKMGYDPVGEFLEKIGMDNE